MDTQQKRRGRSSLVVCVAPFFVECNVADEFFGGWFIRWWCGARLRKRSAGAAFAERCFGRRRQPPERAARAQVFAHALKDAWVELCRATKQTLQRLKRQPVLKQFAPHALVQLVQRRHHR